jgi:hypothetical protein
MHFIILSWPGVAWFPICGDTDDSGCVMSVMTVIAEYEINEPSYDKLNDRCLGL